MEFKLSISSKLEFKKTEKTELCIVSLCKCNPGCYGYWCARKCWGNYFGPNDEGKVNGYVKAVGEPNTVGLIGGEKTEAKCLGTKEEEPKKEEEKKEEEPVEKKEEKPKEEKKEPAGIGKNAEFVENELKNKLKIASAKASHYQGVCERLAGSRRAALGLTNCASISSLSGWRTKVNKMSKSDFDAFKKALSSYVAEELLLSG